MRYIPGFTAGAALGEAGMRPRTEAAAAETIDAVIAQAPKGGGSLGGATCHARCVGSYLGSATACALEKDTELCLALAAQRFDRCDAFCDLIYTSLG